MGTNTIILTGILCILSFYAAIWKIDQVRERNRRKKLMKKCKLSELRIGDSFLFHLDSNDVWMVRRQVGLSTRINQRMRSDMKWKHEEDQMEWGDTEVWFLRHTMPLPGEECYVEDLKPGDKFMLQKEADQAVEAMILEKGYEFDKFQVFGSGETGRIGRLTKVKFVNHLYHDDKKK